MSLLESALDILLKPSNYAQSDLNQVGQDIIMQQQEMYNPFSLGTLPDKKNPPRHRKEIYSKWERMLHFAPIAEAMGIHVSAALGGDPETGEMVFITPHQRLKREDLSSAEQEFVKKLEARIPSLQRVLNAVVVKICRDAISYGDAYVRVYGQKGVGVTHLVCNEYTSPPLVQAYEQMGKTIAYHILDAQNLNRTLTKLNHLQMVRMQMPRMLETKQYNNAQTAYIIQTLQADSIDDVPVLPAKVGGSFCAEVESIYDNLMLALSAMNSQQIADAVQQVFLTVNMTAMPASGRKKWIENFTNMMTNHRDFIKDAFKGGEAVYATNFHILPTADEKQVVNPLGDLKGTRSSPVNIETFMLNVRLLMGGLGLDPSMVGWADMLAGGLGDGSAFHTSAQILKRAMMIRQACKDVIHNIIAIDWGYAYNEVFENPLDYVWDIQFYSDQSAGMTEMISNQQARMGSVSLQLNVLQQMKELGLSEPVIANILERKAGFDYDDALNIAKDLAEKEPHDDEPQDETEDEF